MSDWYGAMNRAMLSVAIDTDAGADQVFPLFRATRTCTIKSAYAVMTDAVAANATNWVKLSLMNGGTAGTATTAISGTAGGTAGWTALAPTAMAPSDGVLETGEVVVLKYDENGTVTPGIPMTVHLEVLMQRSADDIDEEMATLVTAVTTLRDIFSTAKAEAFYVSDTRRFFVSCESELTNWLLRLADDRVEAALRVKDRGMGE